MSEKKSQRDERSFYCGAMSTHYSPPVCAFIAAPDTYVLLREKKASLVQVFPDTAVQHIYVNSVPVR